MGDDGQAVMASYGIRREGSPHYVDAGSKTHRSTCLGLAGPGGCGAEFEDTCWRCSGSNFHG